MKITKKIGKISWLAFDVIWLVVMFLLNRIEYSQGFVGFFAEGYLVIMISFIMPAILLLFNLLYFFLYKTKNYSAMLILTLMFIGLGLMYTF